MTTDRNPELSALAPRWMRDLERLLPIRAQFIVSGNIRDHFLTSVAPGVLTPAPLRRCLWQALSRQDFRLLLIYDPVEGVRPYPREAATEELATRLFKLKLQDDGAMPMSLDHLAGLMKELTRTREVRAALVIDFASRLTRHPDQLDANEHRFFLAAERLAVNAAPVALKAPQPGEDNRPRFNPVLWLLNRPQDLPSWFALDNTRIESLTIGLPEYETREAAARSYFSLFSRRGDHAGEIAAADLEANKAKFAATFARATEGLPLTALSDTAQLADRQGIAWQRVEDAVQCYKVGVLENPWKKPYLRQRIAAAAAQIETRVKGQPQAVTKTVDILMRSVMGLTGAQTKSGGNRPRGVLFFAGPTGVGKTELAKTLTELVFGDERAYIRFDMSEFAAEHAGARLLGAPPGYVGFEAGGELTNAVREKPFSVVLFDEVEKAHPRILDKFLQILEDGRLTDGRGDVAYFSETILVFTSNLGIFVEDEHGRRVQNVALGDAYETVETRVKGAIADYFKYRLSRPEILNRIGDNIVVFNFITPPVAERIFAGMLDNIVRRVHEEHRLALHFTAEVRENLKNRCTAELDQGGRGIGNRLESCFINPLARALFALDDLEARTEASIVNLAEDEAGIVCLTLQ
ncbi:chaperone [Betaproteobacteria bacterium]|nr:chaperone [Betaproteobacteria bacterium]GHU06499.1 chaperone [Betaproteobacteria bacterium]GHU30368.1 chaperone [Betaproteobacteria bacterium]